LFTKAKNNKTAGLKIASTLPRFEDTYTVTVVSDGKEHKFEDKINHFIDEEGYFHEDIFATKIKSFLSKNVK